MKNTSADAFEKGMEQLEEIVRGMETGEMTLSDSFDAYQKGMELYKSLTRMLDEGDARILKLCADQSVQDITEELKV